MIFVDLCVIPVPSGDGLPHSLVYTKVDIWAEHVAKMDGFMLPLGRQAGAQVAIFRIFLKIMKKSIQEGFQKKHEKIIKLMQKWMHKYAKNLEICCPVQ